MRSILKPALAKARMAACAPGPGVRGPEPPGALTLMCMAVIPLSFAVSAAAVAARMAAYGEDSNLSAFTNMPPVVLAIVSAPEMSVMWISVLLYELKMWTTAHFSFLLLELIAVPPFAAHLVDLRLSERLVLADAMDALDLRAGFLARRLFVLRLLWSPSNLES